MSTPASPPQTRAKKRVGDVVPGDVVSCGPGGRPTGRVTHSHPARGCWRRPYRGGPEEPAWLIVWRYLDGPNEGMRGDEFCTPDDEVYLG